MHESIVTPSYMSNRPPNSSPGPLDYLALRYLRQALDTTHPTDEPYVLNVVERRVIGRTKVFILILAALLGIVGVLLFYAPKYVWPNLYQDTSATLLGATYNFPLVTTLYATLLLYVEVKLLIAINAMGVRIIMEVCQFPRAHDARYDRHLEALAGASPYKKNRSAIPLGVDPYLTMPRWGLTIFFVLNTARAALTDLFTKLMIGRFAGTLALRSGTLLFSMPIYAAWNAYASWQVLQEAQIRVMAPLTIRGFINELYEEWGTQEQFRSLIMEALNYAGILKRQHNYAHYLLTQTLVDRFGLDMGDTLPGNLAEQMNQLPADMRRSLERLIVFGVLVDGRLSWHEKRQLRQLRSQGLLTYSAETIQRIGNDYNQGRGLWV